MRDKLIAYVQSLFRNAADTPQNRDLKEEILQNTLDRYDDLVAGGTDPETAYRQAVSNLGDVESLLEKAPVTYRPQPDDNRSRRAAWIATAVVLGVFLLVIIGGVLLLGLNFTGHRGAGFHEAPESRVERVEESVENWAENVEQAVEHAVDTALESGIGSVAGFAYHYKNEDSFSVGSAQVDTRNVNRLVIDWVEGSVTVEPYEGDSIAFSEPEQDREKDRLRWRQEGDTLTVRYCASTDSCEAAAKDLTVQVPADLWSALQYVQINTVSADAYVARLEAGELQFDSVSGNLETTGFYRILDVDTVSGGVDFSGTAGEVELDTTSGAFFLNFSEIPRELSFDSASGDLTLALPEGRSLEVDFTTASGDFHNDYGAFRRDDGEMYFEGTERGEPAELEFDTVSGDVRIERAAAAKQPA